MKTRRVLVVEDDRDMSDLLVLHLKDQGYRVEVARDGVGGLALAGSAAFDLVVLDILLPGLDGLEVCRRLRSKGCQVPVLILSAKSSEVDRIVGLELGADDYLTKPFGIRVFLARVKAILRRVDDLTGRGRQGGEVFTFGEMTVDLDRHVVILSETPVELTPKEFDLLAQLARNPGRVYTRAQLLDLVWGYTHIGYEHTVSSHINRLRAKVEADPGKPEYILTVWGYGYKFNEGLKGCAGR